MHAPIRYRSPYRRFNRDARYERPGGDIQERFIVQGMVCGVMLAALLVTVLIGLPFTERLRADAASLIQADFTESLPLGPVANMFEQARYFVFGELPEAGAPTLYIPEPPVPVPVSPAPVIPYLPSPPPAPSSHGTNTALSYEGNEHNTFYELGEEERLFIEDIIRKIHEADSREQYEVHPPYGGVPDEHPQHGPEGFDAQALAPAVPPGAARISSPFGYRTNPVTGRSEMHNGVDMAFAHGTPVVAIQDGVVTEIGYNAYSGNYIRYLTSDGLLVGYAHLYRTLVQVGDIVRQGEAVALTGNSGLSTGPHLHVTIWQDGITIDPLTVFAAAH